MSGCDCGWLNSVGAQIQANLVAHNVQASLNAGLGFNLLGFPKFGLRIPIFLVPGDFDSDGNAGDNVVHVLRGHPVEADTVVRTDDPPKARALRRPLDELFHAYNSACAPLTTGRPGYGLGGKRRLSAGQSRSNGLPEPEEFDSLWMQPTWVRNLPPLQSAPATSH